MSEEEFGPELRVWILEHFQTMAPGAIWRPEGTGLRYRKKDETTLTLQHRIDHPDSLHHHERIKRLCDVVKIEIEDDDVMVTSPALSAEEAYMIEMQERQQIAAGWTIPDGKGGEKRLVDLPLDKAYPKYLGDREILLDDGNTTTIEDWAVALPYTAFRDSDDTDEEVMMNPDDYNLMAGDALFMRYLNGRGDWVKAMTRAEMLETAEAGATGILVGKTCPLTQVKVPPWMWGTYCDIIRGDEEE
jgi:hypothetical protein|tara:strand:+ start:1603 stop:2337 length:735 start_codon:yes stop_codon:yes gene_type:complete